MRVDASVQAAQAVQEPSSTEALQQRLHVQLLKKTLEMQKEQAAEISRLAEGKGQVLDIRV